MRGPAAARRCSARVSEWQPVVPERRALGQGVTHRRARDVPGSMRVQADGHRGSGAEEAAAHARQQLHEIRGDQASGEFIAFWLRDGIVTAAMNVNIWDVSDDLRRLLGARIDRSQLADDDVTLEDLAAGAD